MALNCGGSIIRIPNRYGDCSSCIYLMDSEQEFKEYEESHKKYFNKEVGDYISYFSFFHLENAHLLDYDFPTEFDMCDTGIVLDGDYHIYVWSGKVYFVKVV